MDRLRQRRRHHRQRPRLAGEDEEGHAIDPEDLAHISPYLTERIRRFGEYSTHEIGIQPGPYDPHLDVDFSPLRGDGPPAPDGYGQAA